MKQRVNKFFRGDDPIYEVPADGSMEKLDQSLYGVRARVRVPKCAYRLMLNPAGMIVRAAVTTGASLQDLTEDTPRNLVEKHQELGFVLADECPTRTIRRDQMITIMGSEEGAEPCDEDDEARMGEFTDRQGTTRITTCKHVDRIRELRKADHNSKMQISEIRLKDMEQLLLAQEKKKLVDGRIAEVKARAAKQAAEIASAEEKPAGKRTEK